MLAIASMDVRQYLYASTIRGGSLADAPNLPSGVQPATILTCSSSVKRIGRALVAMIEVLFGAHPPTPRLPKIEGTGKSQLASSK